MGGTGLVGSNGPEIENTEVLNPNLNSSFWQVWKESHWRAGSRDDGQNTWMEEGQSFEM